MGDIDEQPILFRLEIMLHETTVIIIYLSSYILYLNIKAFSLALGILILLNSPATHTWYTIKSALFVWPLIPVPVSKGFTVPT